LGPLYFLRAVIEYDRNQYGDALQDADLAENNAWASGSYIAYIEGLEAVRLGHREEAISKLQYAEATFTWDYPFVIQRCRDELKKLGTEPITVTPSVNIRTTTMPKK